MKILKPLQDVYRYIRIYQLYIGVRMYLIYILGIISSFLEGIGILMLLPLLQSLDEGSSIESESVIGETLNSFINYLGLSDSMYSILVIIAIAFIIKGVITFFAHGLTASMMGTLLKEIKMRLFELYSNMSYHYFSSKNTGDLINLINEQPTQALRAFRQLAWLGSHFINTIVLMSLAFLITFSFGAMALGFGVIILILFMKMNTYVQTLSRITAEENGTLTKWLIQSLHGFKYLISTNQITSLKRYIFKSISILTNTQVKSGIASAFTQSVREPIVVVFIISILYIQIYYFNSRIEPILVSLVLFYRALNSTLEVQTAFQATFQYIGSMELVHKEFITQKQNQLSDGEISIGKLSKEIDLKNLSFSYEKNSKGVRSISINIPAKSSIAFIGESGSGKTTLADIITLTHKYTSGDMYIDGVSSNRIKKSSWNSQIGYVSQETLIFDDTIANNITMWKDDIKDPDALKRIRDVADQANILDFIETLEDGFNTKVGDRGVLLSGGQKQRIFIARELYRNPNLLILDEATSALDSESEIKIQESIESLKGKITVIIIAHRISTIKNVDKIYIMENGKIVESGNFKELKNNNQSKLSQMVELQLI